MVSGKILDEEIAEGVEVPGGAITVTTSEIHWSFRIKLSAFALDSIDNILDTLDPSLIIVGVIIERLYYEVSVIANFFGGIIIGSSTRIGLRIEALDHLLTFFERKGVLGSAS